MSVDGKPAPKRGRPTSKPLTVYIKARATAEEREKFVRLGGSEWLRRKIAEAEEVAQ